MRRPCRRRCRRPGKRQPNERIAGTRSRGQRARLRRSPGHAALVALSHLAAPRRDTVVATANAGQEQCWRAYRRGARSALPGAALAAAPAIRRRWVFPARCRRRCRILAAMPNQPERAAMSRRDCDAGGLHATRAPLMPPTRCPLLGKTAVGRSRRRHAPPPRGCRWWVSADNADPRWWRNRDRRLTTEVLLGGGRAAGTALDRRPSRRCRWTDARRGGGDRPDPG